jgi:hypothetical protein
MFIEYKKFSSLYELYYVKWNGIEFDKEKLILFTKRMNFLKFTSIFIKSHKEELKILKEIYNSYNQSKLLGLLNNDPQISKGALIEKWSRIGAIDILLTGVFSRSTYTVLVNLPAKDYQLAMKRVEELVKIGKEMTYQSENITDNIPGT